MKRPGVEEFLEKMQKLYEVVIFTASLSIYADQLLDQIDPNHYASYRLFREHCTFFNNAFVKDLSVIGRDMKDIIIIDNSPNSYAYQPENAIPILTWIDDIEDNKLGELAPLLEKIANVDDVRNAIKIFVKDNNVDYVEALQILENCGSKRGTNKKFANRPTHILLQQGIIKDLIPMTPQCKSIFY